MPATSTAGNVLSGAATGAAAGSAVPIVGTTAGAIIGGLGGLLTGLGTQSAQNTANATAAQQAAMQSAQAFANYLSSRGINLQQIAAAHPEYQNEWNRVKSAGDKRDFQTWLYDHLRSNPGDALWNEINTGSVGAQNTTLPAWAVDASGNPLQPALLQQLLGISTGAANPATAPIATLATLENTHALLQARPDLAQQLADAGVGNDGRSPEQWLVDHITQTESQNGGGTFTDALRQFVVNGGAAGGTTPGTSTAPGTNAGPAGTGSNLTLDPAISALISKGAQTVGGIFDGSLLKDVTGALGPVAAARDAAAAAQLAKVNELRGLSGTALDTELAGINSVLNARKAGAGGIYDATLAGAGGIYDASAAAAGGVRDAGTAGANDVYSTNVNKLASLLGVRRDAAQSIYDASLGAAGGLRDARNTGAGGIYDAEKLRADTYNTAAQQALSRVLAEQSAERARRGFTGGSSGSDIVRARLMADYTQRGAGERAQAGVNYANRLSDSGIGYAGDVGRAGVGKATSVGAANEQDAIAQLNAAVDRAKSLGLINTNFASAIGAAGVNRATTTAGAGVTQASTLAGAGEADAVAQLQARMADAQRRLGYLTSDADIAKANADLANAQDQLNAIVSNQNRMTSSIGAPFQLASADLGLKDALAGQKYADLDALLKRLSTFSINPASGPSLTTTTPGSVLNTGQIVGGALTGIGSGIGNAASNASLQDLIKLLNPGSAGTTPPPPNTTGLLSSGNYLAGASVFNNPFDPPKT